MHIQFFSPRSFIVSKEDVIKVVKGAFKDRAGTSIIIPNKSIVDLKEAKAKKMLKLYPKECEAWGVDATEKKSVVKGKNASKSKGHANRDIA